MMIGRKATLLFFILAANLERGETIAAYDCSNTEGRVLYKSLDLTEPERCPDPVNEYDAPITKRVQILHTDTSMPAIAHQCNIQISERVSRCGHSSISFGSTWLSWERTVEVTPEQCRRAVMTGDLKIDGRDYTVKVGERHQFNFYAYGGLDRDGNCVYGTFRAHGEDYQYSSLQVILEVHVQEIRGTHDGLTLTLSNGLAAPLRDMVLNDVVEGTIVWKVRDPKCEDTVSQLYLGKAEVHQKANGETGAIIMIKDSTTQQYAGLILKEKAGICGSECHATQIKGVAVCLLREMDEPIPERNFKDHFKQGQADLEARISFARFSTNLRVYRRFEEVQAAICEVERKTAWNKLQAVSGADNKHALIDLYGRGHQVMVTGAVAYIQKCPKVEVPKADFQNCTQEIPVIVGNDTMFVDPYTRILQTVATVVPCSDVMPVRWKIGGRWYCATPALHTCEAPRKLNLTTTVGFTPLGDFTEGAGFGLFSPAQKAQHASFQEAMTSRRAVIQSITNAATMGSHGGYPGSPLTQLNVDNLRDHLGGFFFPLFPLVGKLWYSIVTAMMVLTAVKILGTGLLRMLILYGERGCGCWMIGAMSSTLFQVARTPIDLIWTILEQLSKKDAGGDRGQDRPKERQNGMEDNGSPMPSPPPSPPPTPTRRNVASRLRAASQAVRRQLQPHAARIQPLRQSGMARATGRTPTSYRMGGDGWDERANEVDECTVELAMAGRQGGNRTPTSNAPRAE